MWGEYVVSMGEGGCYGGMWGDVSVEGVSKLICRINNWREWSGQHKCVKI